MGKALTTKSREWVRRHKGYIDINCPDWEATESMQKLYRGVTNENSRKNLKKGLKPWFGWVGVNHGFKSPDEIIAKRVEQRDTIDYHYFEDIMFEYRKVLIDLDYAPSTIHTRLGQVFSFFSHNGLPLKVGRGFFDVEGSEKAKARRRTRQQPSNAEIRKVYNIANLEEKAIVLLGYQWGLNNADIIGMTWQNIGLSEAPKGEDFYLVEWIREKSGESSDKVMNPDIKWCLNQLWEMRGKPTSGYVFINNWGNPFDSKSINLKWKALISQVVSEERAEAIPFKSLRRSFNESLLMANPTQEIKDALMGHVRRGARRAYPIGNLVETYKKAFKFLAVNAWTLKSERDQQIDEKFIEQGIELSNLTKTSEQQTQIINALTTSVNLLREQNEGLREELDSSKKELRDIKQLSMQLLEAMKKGKLGRFIEDIMQENIKQK